MELEGKRVRLHIWDTAGQERYRSITSSYFRNSDAILIVFDVTENDSFKQVVNWVEHLQEQVGPRTKILLVGNKCDQEGFVNLGELRDYSNQNALYYREVSAKSGVGVNELFNDVATMLKDYVDAHPYLQNSPGTKISGNNLQKLNSDLKNKNSTPKPQEPPKTESSCC